MPRRLALRIGAPTLVLALTLALTAGGALAPAAAASGAGDRPVARFAKHGPYPVGVTTLRIGDRDVEVWYPSTAAAIKGTPRDVYELARWLPQGIQDLLAARGVKAPFVTDAHRDVDASPKGPFPLVLFAHGAAAWRSQSTFLTTHLASWGFVVASPDFLERGLAAQLGAPPAQPRTDDDVLDASVAAVRAANRDRTSPLHRTVRRGKIAITGHSAGARAAVVYAQQRRVATYIPLAGAVFGRGDTPPPAAPDKPSLYLAGADDGIVAVDRIRGYFTTVPAPKRLVVVHGAGHLNAMTDICEIGTGGGGVVAIAKAAGLPVPDMLARLGTDGCFPPALPSRQLWPVTRHFEVAMLRYELGIDRKPVGLQPSIVKAWPKLTIDYTIVK
jgi:dienelactone hydrolase